METNAYGGPVIQPRSMVKPRGGAIEHFGSESIRIGYYRRMDGLNCVWLVNAEGEYYGFADQRYLRENFDIIERSDETDLYGESRPVLEALQSVS
jgi:hypothetical protein